MIERTYQFEWDGILIAVTHSDRFAVYEHLAIESLEPERAPLPMTETGYRSHFLTADELSQYDTPVDYVRAWLNHEAANPKWHAQKAKAAQYNLF